MNNAYTQYKNQSLATMAQGELLVKVFDELIKQCRLAEIALEEGSKGAEHDCLVKAQTILSTLADALDERIELSAELRNLYIFFAHELRDANLKKDIKKIHGIVPLIKDLRNSFEQADKLSRSTKQKAPIGVGGQAI